MTFSKVMAKLQLSRSGQTTMMRRRRPIGRMSTWPATPVQALLAVSLMKGWRTSKTQNPDLGDSESDLRRGCGVIELSGRAPVLNPRVEYLSDEVAQSQFKTLFTLIDVNPKR